MRAEREFGKRLVHSQGCYTVITPPHAGVIILPRARLPVLPPAAQCRQMTREWVWNGSTHSVRIVGGQQVGQHERKSEAESIAASAQWSDERLLPMMANGQTIFPSIRAHHVKYDLFVIRD